MTKEELRAKDEEKQRQKREGGPLPKIRAKFEHATLVSAFIWYEAYLRTEPVLTGLDNAQAFRVQYRGDQGNPSVHAVEENQGSDGAPSARSGQGQD